MFSGDPASPQKPYACHRYNYEHDSCADGKCCGNHRRVDINCPLKASSRHGHHVQSKSSQHGERRRPKQLLGLIQTLASILHWWTRYLALPNLNRQTARFVVDVAISVATLLAS